MSWKKVADILNNGGVAVVPTDTLYGLVARAGNTRAARRVYLLKGRDAEKSCIILIDSMKKLSDVGVHLDARQKRFLEKVWPGEVSVVLPAKKKTIAFRIPKRKKLLELLKKTGPLIAPSANLQGKKPARTIKEAKQIFGNAVDFYVGGRVKGRPSTLIAFENEKIIILREGIRKIKREY